MRTPTGGRNWEMGGADPFLAGGYMLSYDPGLATLQN